MGTEKREMERFEKGATMKRLYSGIDFQSVGLLPSPFYSFAICLPPIRRIEKLTNERFYPSPHPPLPAAPGL